MNPFGTKTMKRLSLEELKAQKTNVVANLDAIKGGDTDKCHIPEIKIDSTGTHYIWH